MAVVIRFCPYRSPVIEPGNILLFCSGTTGFGTGKIIKKSHCIAEAMIEKKAARGNILWFRLAGKLTEEDYTDNLIPELERALEQYRKIRLLVQVEYFGGWTEGGAWEELKGWPQFSKIERMAIVADDSWDEWMTWMVKITGIFTGLVVRFFGSGRIEEAWDWLESRIGTGIFAFFYLTDGGNGA